MKNRSFLTAKSSIRSKVAGGGKALAYFLLAFVGALLATGLAKSVLGASLLELARGGAMAGATRALLLLLGVVVLPTALVLRFFKEPFRLSGWAFDKARNMAICGLATGFSLLGIVASLMWLSGTVMFHISAPSMFVAISGFLLAAILWVAQAAGEEGLFRGYAFVQFCRAISFWPTSILSSILFMYAHLGNEGESVPGIIAAGLLGVALSYSFLKTGSLWFALGFHASWNFAQSFIFGFHNSGTAPPASLLSANISGPPFITGGATGPEGSVFMFPMLIVLLAIIQRVGRSCPPRALEPETTFDGST